MTQWIEQWKADRLRGAMVLCWLLTVFSSFFGAYLLPVTVPVLGTLFPFRVLLPTTAVLYLVWAVKHREPLFWRGASTLEKLCFILCGILLAYGAASLFRAIDFGHTFRRLFNLCFDLCFFLLMLRLCRDRDIRRKTLWLCFGMLAFISLLGIYEVFFGGVVNSVYDPEETYRFFLFKHVYQYPVVFYVNTNDLVMLLTFLYTVESICYVRSEQAQSGALTAAFVLQGAAVYFLLLASSSRLCILSFNILLLGLFVYFVITQRRWLRAPVFLLLCVLGIQFVNQYRFIVPPIQTYFAELDDYQESKGSDSENVTEEKPSLSLGNPNKSSLGEEFFTQNEETGQQELQLERSGGVRAKLLLHAFTCFRESYGLGVGLGNTETLAARQTVIPAWADNPQNSIHCFLARLTADCGIFALLPLCAVAFLLLKRTFQALLAALRRKDREGCAYGLFFLLCLVIYPIASTASSDAQDSIAMWIYLAAVVLFCLDMSLRSSGETAWNAV